MKMKNFQLIIFFLSCLSSVLFPCQSNDHIESILQYSGENRNELEKVINHYSQNEEDSLQLKAALFLIEKKYIALKLISCKITTREKSKNRRYQKISTQIESF